MLICDVKVKNQHYVPRGYLQAFTDNGKHFWVYDKAEQKSFKASINDVAAAKYFYDYLPLDNEHGEQWLEKKLSWLEGYYPKKLATLEQNGWVFDKGLKEYFAAFITYQLYRTKAFRHGFRQMKEQVASLLAREENGEEQIKQLGLDKPTTRKDDQIQFLLSETPGKVMEVFRSWIWQVMDNQTKADFLTSDSPVVRLSPMEAQNVYGVVYHLPISPLKGILIIDPLTNNLKADVNKPPKVIKNKEWVKGWNELQVVWSYRQVYQFRDNTKFVEKTIRKFPGLRDVDAPKIFVKASGINDKEDELG